MIENEFGAVDVDGDLVASRTFVAEDVLLLNNGCLCCSVRGDLVKMLAQLVRTKRGLFDHVVIETTGLANPAPIIQTFYLEPDLVDTCRLDGVVTLVDAKHVHLHLQDARAPGVVCEALEQVALADRLVLNKTDLVTPAELAALESRLRAINGVAAITRAQRGAVDVGTVLGVGGFDLSRVVDDAMFAPPPEAHSHAHSHGHASAEEEAACTDPSHNHGHAHSHGHASAEEEAACTDPSHDHGHGHSHGAAPAVVHHTDAVSSVSLVQDGDLDLDAVNDWLGDLLQERWQDMYRMKGVLAIAEFPERYVLQGVHSLFEGQVDRDWAPGEKRTSKIVFIGKGLDEAELREGFASCLL